MCILIDRDTSVIVQGITGTVGSFQTKIMKEYGTNIVAGVTPGKGGKNVHGIPVYDLVEEAVSLNKADVSILFVPGPYAADAAIEAIEAGVKLIVITAEGVPIQDLIKVFYLAVKKEASIIGPDTAGLISPGKSKVGVHPHKLFREGNIGIVSKSGALSYEVSKALSEAGIGQSTVVGIGGGPIWDLTQPEVIKLFNNDKETEGIILLGEIGGNMEEKAAEYIKSHVTKPVISLIVGRHAPEEEKMGHAGALIHRGEGRADVKMDVLRDAGVYLVKEPIKIPPLIKEILY
jgi:succinyl-CoA synthetase alpha subunit